jgi:putative ABC transport system permease protein
MNIMLASILERIREIGVRRAVGAPQEILFQFLSEAVLISVRAGRGHHRRRGLSSGIERVGGIRTFVSFLSVFVAFGVSFAVGLASDRARVARGQSGSGGLSPVRIVEILCGLC